MTAFATKELERLFTYLTLEELETLLRTLAPQFEGLAEGIDESGFFDAIDQGGEEDPFLECPIRLDGKDESFLLRLFDEDEERFEALFILSSAAAAWVRAALPPGALLPPGARSAFH